MDKTENITVGKDKKFRNLTFKVAGTYLKEPVSFFGKMTII